MNDITLEEALEMIDCKINTSDDVCYSNKYVGRPNCVVCNCNEALKVIEEALKSKMVISNE